MSLAKRLSSMEARIRTLEQVIEQALQAEEVEDAPALTLDGDEDAGERDQDQPL